jgi:hypothetical protein
MVLAPDVVTEKVDVKGNFSIQGKVTIKDIFEVLYVCEYWSDFGGGKRDRDRWSLMQIVIRGLW